VLERQGKYEEAEAMHQRVEGYERVLGVDDLHTLTSISNLGLALERQGKYEEAEAMHRRALEGREKMLGVEHPDTLTSISNLGLVLEKQGKYEEAEAIHRRALEGREKMLRVEHPDTLTSVSNLGSALEAQGKYEEAGAMHQRALAGREKMLGVYHPDTLSSMVNLASTYCEQRRWDEAEDLQVEVIVTRKRVLGAEHQDTLTSIANLASTYRSQGRWKEAEELEVQVIEMSSSVASGDEDIRSTVETESGLSPLRVAAAWLIAKRFSEDQNLFTLYRLALKKLDQTRFIRNNRRLLKSYYLCLKAEAQTTPEGKLVVSFLRLRATRTQISSHIYRILVPEILDLEGKAPSTDEYEYSLNRYLQSIETNNELMVEEPLRNNEVQSNFSSDEDGVDGGDDDGDGDAEDNSVDVAAHDVTHAHLRKAAQLLTTGQPFNSYKKSLHDFVFSKFIPGPTQTYTEVREPLDSRENQDQNNQEVQNIGDQRDDPTTTLVSGNDPADHISWNDSETLFSRSQIAPIKDINKEPHHSKKTFNLMGFLSNLHQSFLLQCLNMAEDIGLYERALSRGFVRLHWDCVCTHSLVSPIF
jgi:tetratricopeptide (TPR) repeat protein